MSGSVTVERQVVIEKKTSNCDRAHCSRHTDGWEVDVLLPKGVDEDEARRRLTSRRVSSNGARRLVITTRTTTVEVVS